MAAAGRRSRALALAVAVGLSFSQAAGDDVAENLVVEAYIGLEILFEDESGIVGPNSLRTMLEISEARHLRQLIREVRRQRRQERRRDDG